jgi:hypothetical protein
VREKDATKHLIKRIERKRRFEKRRGKRTYQQNNAEHCRFIQNRIEHIRTLKKISKQSRTEQNRTVEDNRVE